MPVCDAVHAPASAAAAVQLRSKRPAIYRPPPNPPLQLARSLSDESIRPGKTLAIPATLTHRGWEPRPLPHRRFRIAAPPPAMIRAARARRAAAVGTSPALPSHAGQTRAAWLRQGLHHHGSRSRGPSLPVAHGPSLPPPWRLSAAAGPWVSDPAPAAAAADPVSS